MPLLDERRRLSIMLDYVFGKGVGRAASKGELRLVYSKRSGRVKLVFVDGKLFATVKPSGAFALTMYGAKILSKRPAFRKNYVVVADEVAEFVHGGKSVFCKFVKSAGSNVYPKSEVAVVDSKGKVLGVGLAVMNGKHMSLFKSGVAVKVRTGIER